MRNNSNIHRTPNVVMNYANMYIISDNVSQDSDSGQRGIEQEVRQI